MKTGLERVEKIEPNQRTIVKYGDYHQFNAVILGLEINILKKKTTQIFGHSRDSIYLFSIGSHTNTPRMNQRGPLFLSFDLRNLVAMSLFFKFRAFGTTEVYWPFAGFRINRD